MTGVRGYRIGDSTLVFEDDLERWARELEESTVRAPDRVAKLAAWRAWSKEKHAVIWVRHLEAPSGDQVVDLLESPAWAALENAHRRILDGILRLFTPYRPGSWKRLEGRGDWDLHKIVVNLPILEWTRALVHDPTEEHEGEPERYPCLVHSEEHHTETESVWRHVFVYEDDARLLLGTKEGGGE